MFYNPFIQYTKRNKAAQNYTLLVKRIIFLLILTSLWSWVKFNRNKLQCISTYEECTFL